MARKCPICFAAVPRSQLLAYSNDLECPLCQRPLELSGLGRNISALAGLIVAAIVWRIASAHYFGQPGLLGWALPVLFSYLAYSIIAPLVLVLVGDLRLKPEASFPVAMETSPSHSVPH
jgi:hypothetical protein